MVKRVGMNVRIGNGLKFIKAGEHVDCDRAGRVGVVIVHTVDLVGGLGSSS